MGIPVPFRLPEVTVLPEWTDYNHHLTESAYLLVMGESSDAFFRTFGVDDDYRGGGRSLYTVETHLMGESSDAFFRTFGVDDDYRGGGRSLYTVETHLRNLREAREGDRLGLTIQVLGTDDKRLHILHEMYSTAGSLLATAEQMILHVDMRAGRATPFPEHVARGLREITAAHAALPVPGYVGRSIRIPEA
jgi:acyl-CoA thioesterase FadM